MAHLIIAGHGMQKDGRFDPGAIGLIKKGEHRYVVEDLFPAMKKFLPKNHNVIFFHKYKVSNYGNIVSLAKQYGATQVTEIHYDASGSPSASGGHVIIHKNYNPDKIDLALRDAIKKMVGVRYSHKGHEGISGRDNLYNVNAMYGTGISYRLIELGFGTSPKDAKIMTEQVEEYAKELVKAIVGSTNDKPVEKQTSNVSKSSSSKTSTTAKKSITQMAEEVIKGLHGNGHEQRRKSLGISKEEYEKVRAEVNRILSGKSTTATSTKNTKSTTSTTSSSTKGIKVGDKVTIKSSAKYYSRTNNTPIPSRYKGKTFTVQQVAKDDVLLKELYSWVKKTDLVGVTAKSTSSTTTSSTSTSKLTIAQMADKIIRDPNAPVGHEARRKWLGIDKATYEKVRQEVNRRLK